MRRPYADRAGWMGRLNYPPDTLRAILAEALAARGITPAHRQLHLHMVGDSTIRLALRLMQDGGFRHVPIVDEGKVVGVVSKGDFRGVEQDRLDEESGIWERI